MLVSIDQITHDTVRDDTAEELRAIEDHGNFLAHARGMISGAVMSAIERFDVMDVKRMIDEIMENALCAASFDAED